jgi:hypothetical protein
LSFSWQLARTLTDPVNNSDDKAIITIIKKAKREREKNRCCFRLCREKKKTVTKPSVDLVNAIDGEKKKKRMHTHCHRDETEKEVVVFLILPPYDRWPAVAYNATEGGNNKKKKRAGEEKGGAGEVVRPPPYLVAPFLFVCFRFFPSRPSKCVGTRTKTRKKRGKQRSLAEEEITKEKRHFLLFFPFLCECLVHSVCVCDVLLLRSVHVLPPAELRSIKRRGGGGRRGGQTKAAATQPERTAVSGLSALKKSP